jgi:hypothetical protein
MKFYQGDVNALVGFGYDAIKLDDCGLQKDLGNVYVSSSTLPISLFVYCGVAFFVILGNLKIRVLLVLLPYFNNKQQCKTTKQQPTDVWAELINATGRPIMIENCHWGKTVSNITH